MTPTGGFLWATSPSRLASVHFRRCRRSTRPLLLPRIAVPAATYSTSRIWKFPPLPLVTNKQLLQTLPPCQGNKQPLINSSISCITKQSRTRAVDWSDLQGYLSKSLFFAASIIAVYRFCCPPWFLNRSAIIHLRLQDFGSSFHIQHIFVCNSFIHLLLFCSTVLMDP